MKTKFLQTWRPEEFCELRENISTRGLDTDSRGWKANQCNQRTIASFHGDHLDTGHDYRSP